VVLLDSLYGDIIEMSFGGLSFRYTAHDSMAAQPKEFALIFGGTELCLDGVPLDRVSDVPLDGGEADGARRMGMVFGDLVPEQVVAMARFIKRFSLNRRNSP